MAGDDRHGAPFDPRWLDALGDACATLGHTNPRLEDLYLERRFELRVTTGSAGRQVEECRTEGAAARWRFANRVVLDASSAVSPDGVQRLLARYSDRLPLPSPRVIPAAELDPPRGWQDWAAAAIDRYRGAQAAARYVVRQAVVVGARRWSTVVTPPLVRLERGGDQPAALLAVWGHAELERWLDELAAPAPVRTWCPTSGTALPVVFTAGTAGVLLHELVGHQAEADLVVSGGSVLAGLAGAAVTAPTIDIVDDPSRRDLPGGFTSDDEGVTADPAAIVQAGLLVGWLCDRAGAAALAADAGRGRRAAWDGPPMPRLSNLVVPAGEVDPAELVRDQTRALLVSRVGGAAVDPVSGRLVLRVERGWEIQHGRRRRALAPFELTGGALEVLARLDPAVGRDPTPDWRLGWCVKDGAGLATGSEAPTLLAHRLEVL